MFQVKCGQSFLLIAVSHDLRLFYASIDAWSSPIYAFSTQDSTQTVGLDSSGPRKTVPAAF